MPDTPSLEEAFDQASAELTSEEGESPKEDTSKTDEPSKVETPVEKPAEDSQEEDSKEQPKEEDSKEEEVEETFADKGDLKGKTPEELEEVYNKWQVAYTKKRQAERKELEELKAKLEAQQVESPVTIPQKPMEQMTPEEYANYVAELAREEVKVAEYNSYIEAQEKSFNESDPRLNQDNPEFDPDLRDLVIMRLTQAREAHEASGKPITEFDFVNEAKGYIEAYDKRLQSIKQSYLQKQSKIARTKTQDFAKESPKVSKAKTKKQNMSLEESINAAMER